MRNVEVMDLIENLVPGELSPEQALLLLGLEDDGLCQALFDRAYAVKSSVVGRVLYLRGIIEYSNICAKNCHYCGIRRDNRAVERYRLDEDEIVQSALWAREHRLGSVVIQGGERSDRECVDFVERVVSRIKTESNGELGITLSLGEQSLETYQRWFAAGAHRYLLRVESSDPELYRRLHPADHDFETRVRCLDLLRQAGYQVGTGVMIGVPGQSLEQLVDDIFFFKKLDVDMIGMGPYIPHADTPTAELDPDFDAHKQARLLLGLKTIAVCRLLLPDVNIASTTALEALAADGRKRGLLAGANIVMPNITDVRFRRAYQLYRGKPGLDETAQSSFAALERLADSIGESIGYGQWGDSRHFAARTM